MNVKYIFLTKIKNNLEFFQKFCQKYMKILLLHNFFHHFSNTKKVILILNFFFGYKGKITLFFFQFAEQQIPCRRLGQMHCSAAINLNSASYWLIV